MAIRNQETLTHLHIFHSLIGALLRIFSAIAAISLCLALLSITAVPTGPTVQFDEDLPLGGLFYGNPFHGDAIGNTKFTKAAAFRFRAEYTGTVTSITYFNRYNTDSENDVRKPDAYSEGDGGRVFAEIQTNGLNNLPSGVSLGRSRTYTPVEEDIVITVELSPLPRLEAGKIYHIVLHQTNLSSGIVSTNNLHTHQPLQPVLGGPYLGSDFAFFTDQGSGWIHRPNAEQQKTPLFQLTYADGTTVGTGYTGAGNQTRVISGSNMARQRFTVEDPTRRVDGVWIRLGRQRNNGTNLTVRLEHGNGTLMEQVTVPEKDVSRTPGGIRDAQIHWFYAPFSKVHELKTGRRYHLVLSAPPDARYIVNALTPMAVRRWTDRNMWTSAGAEWSTDGGSSWGRFHERGTVTDLSVLFTLERGPRAVSIIDGWPRIEALSP